MSPPSHTALANKAFKLSWLNFVLPRTGLSITGSFYSNQVELHVFLTEEGDNPKNTVSFDPIPTISHAIGVDIPT